MKFDLDLDFNFDFELRGYFLRRFVFLPNYFRQQNYKMYPIKDLLIDGIDAQQKVEVPPKPSSLSIQELFINVHRSLKLKQDEESRLRNAALRLPRPVPKRHPEKHKKLSKEEKREKDRKIAVLGLYDCIQTGRSHDEVIRQFVKHNISMHVQQERNCLIELRRPGGGVMTMDFCTMGMFIIGVNRAP